MESDVPHFVKEYPKASPPSTSRDEIFNPKDYTDLDNKVKQAPDKLKNSYDDLMAYLMKIATTDIAKVRAIFIWLSIQPVINVKFPKVVKPDTPLQWLKRIKHERSFYTELFTILCRKAEVPCVIIEGSSKGAGFEVGQEKLKVTNRWNAVHVQGSWHLINVPWAFITVDGITQETVWEVVEKDGKAVREKEEASKEVQEELDEFWFLTDPNDFNAFCHAAHPHWQLLEQPWSDEDFLTTPRYAEDMFMSDWEPISCTKAVVKAKEGKCQITFIHPTDSVQTASLLYNLYFSPTLSPKPLPEELQLNRYVVENSQVGKKSLVTRLPQDGVYRIEIAGDMDGQVTPLGEYRIQCEGVKNQPAAFPEGCKQIGFNEEAATIVTEPSHEEGIVGVHQGERINFNFKFKEGQPPPHDVRATLTHSQRSQSDLQKYVVVKRTNEDLNVSVDYPKDKNFGEIGVIIEAARSSMPHADNQEVEIVYENFLNYILTPDRQLTFPEQKNMMQSMQNLLGSMNSLDVGGFYEALDSAGELDPLTRGKVQEFMKEINKIKVHRKKNLEEAMHGPDVSDLEKALAEYKDLRDVNQDIVVQAEALLKLLRILKDDDNLDDLEEALRQVYDVKMPKNGNVQKAEDTLVSHYGKEIHEAYYKRVLETLRASIAKVEKSVVADRVRESPMHQKCLDLMKHLERAKQVTEKIGRMSKQDLTKIAGKKKQEPHPHVKSIMMATFILLGEREQELWNWEVIQNLLDRRAELGVAKAMASLDMDKVTTKQVDNAAGHVRQCQLDVVKSENANAALFLQWVQDTVEEKRAREAAKDHRSEISYN